MSMHEHPKPVACEHELKHCAECNVVFCPKCKAEWRAHAPRKDDIRGGDIVTIEGFRDHATGELIEYVARMDGGQMKLVPREESR